MAMRTQDLVSRLAWNVPPVERDAVQKRLTHALTTGLGGSAVLLVALYGISSDMPQQILTPMFWFRLAFPLASVAAALKLAERLASPGVSLGLAWLATLLPIAAMLLVAATLWLATPPHYRLQWDFGTTGWTASAAVVLLSLPSLAAVMHALKRLAPTRLTLTGAAAGLLGGSQGLLVYALYCSETPVPFWSIWHVSAILITAGIGTVCGPRYLRW